MEFNIFPVFGWLWPTQKALKPTKFVNVHNLSVLNYVTVLFCCTSVLFLRDLVDTKIICEKRHRSVISTEADY